MSAGDGPKEGEDRYYLTAGRSKKSGPHRRLESALKMEMEVKMNTKHGAENGKKRMGCTATMLLRTARISSQYPKQARQLITQNPSSNRLRPWGEEVPMHLQAGHESSYSSWGQNQCCSSSVAGPRLALPYRYRISRGHAPARHPASELYSPYPRPLGPSVKRTERGKEWLHKAHFPSAFLIFDQNSVFQKT